MKSAPVRRLLTAILLCGVSLSASALEKIRIAIREAPGYCFIDESGKRRGYAVEWFERLALRLDWDVEWVNVTNGSSSVALAENRAELAPFTLTSTGEPVGFRRTNIPMGFTRMSLFVPFDSIFEADDLGKMNGIVIGMISGNPQRGKIIDYLAANGVKCVCREFATEDELSAALASGLVGAAFGEATRVLCNNRRLLQLPAVPIYVAVAQSRADLIPAIDEAVAEIVNGEPGLPTSLRARYFRDDRNLIVSFSAEERAWIRRQHRLNRVFTVDISPVDEFIKIYDEKGETIGGLTGRILAEVSAQTGLRFRPLKPRGHAEVTAAFEANGIDIRIPYGCTGCGVQHDDDPSRVVSVLIPQAVATRHFSGTNIDDAKSMIAVARTDTARLAEYERIGLMNRVIVFPDAEAALQAVVEERADCYLADYPLVHRLVRELPDPLLIDIRINEHPRYSSELRMLVGPAVDRNLVTVLAKSMAFLDCDRLVAFEDDAEAKDVNIGRVELRKLFRYAGAVLLIVFALIIAILLYFGIKTRKLLHKSEASLIIAQDAIDDAAMARTRMREALEEAKYAAQVKTNFLATMSHEIRTPLNAVVGFSEFLAAPDITLDKVGEYARGISLSANALLSLINDILDYSKFESGKTEGLDIRFGECDFAALFAEMDTVFRMRIERKGLTLSFSGAEGVPPLVLSVARIRQILLNLLGNAVKFTERGGIKVDAEYGESRLRLRVKDTGIGISPRGIEHIFDPFAQDMDSRGGKVYAGTGLGLPIVKRIVEASGGSVKVKSSIGRGSEFVVEIPEVRVAAHAVVSAADLPRTEKRELVDVIIVDDVAMNRKVLKMHCTALGIRNPIVFESGLEVLDYLKNPANPCDIVLSDMWMPGMDGSELAKHCAELRPSLPVVAVTADTDAGATFDISLFKGILTKPVTAEKLSGLLAKFR